VRVEVSPRRTTTVAGPLDRLAPRPRRRAPQPFYLGRDGAAVVILLAGGTKARQQQDIEKARELWRDYRRRKREEV